MSICTDMSLVASLFPEAAIDKIKTINQEPFAKNEGNEKRMQSVAKLIISVMEKTAQAILKNDLIQFDALTGNHTCQLVSLFVHNRANSQELLQEAKDLSGTVTKLKANLQQWMKEKKTDHVHFFEKNFENLSVSRDMSFLMKCFLLYQVQNKDFSCKTDVNKLNRLTGKSLLDSDIKNDLIDHCRSKLSEESLTFLQNEIYLLNEDTTLFQRMFSELHIRKIAYEGHLEKTFSPLFFQMQAVLKLIKKQGAIVAMQQIGKGKQQRKELFFRSSETEFKEIAKKDISIDTPIIVFKMVVNSDLDQKDLAQKVGEIGFEKIVLMLAAQEPPYDRKTSKLSDLRDKEAIRMITDFKKEAAQIDLDKNNSPFLEFRHILCVPRSKLDEIP